MKRVSTAWWNTSGRVTFSPLIDSMQPSRILVVRLGAMGDVIHALPAVTTLKRNFPAALITWVIDPKWAPLLDDNPHISEVAVFNRRNWSSIRSTWSLLRRHRFDTAIDLQGLMKSGLLTAVSGAATRIGFHRSQAREPLASWFYNRPVRTAAAHVVDQNLELAAAAGANRISREFPVPRGAAEGDLPKGPFVLACPMQGGNRNSGRWNITLRLPGHYGRMAARWS